MPASLHTCLIRACCLGLSGCIAFDKPVNDYNLAPRTATWRNAPTFPPAPTTKPTRPVWAPRTKRAVPCPRPLRPRSRRHWRNRFPPVTSCACSVPGRWAGIWRRRSAPCSRPGSAGSGVFLLSGSSFSTCSMAPCSRLPARRACCRNCRKTASCRVYSPSAYPEPTPPGWQPLPPLPSLSCSCSSATRSG